MISSSRYSGVMNNLGGAGEALGVIGAYKGLSSDNVLVQIQSANNMVGSAAKLTERIASSMGGTVSNAAGETGSAFAKTSGIR